RSGRKRAAGARSDEIAAYSLIDRLLQRGGWLRRSARRRRRHRWRRESAGRRFERRILLRRTLIRAYVIARGSHLASFKEKCVEALVTVIREAYAGEPR